MDNIGDNTYYEKINHVKLIYILQNRKRYEAIIEKDKSENGNANEASIWAIMKKMYKNVIQIPYSEYGYIPVKYVKGKSCNNIGRWYAESSIGLAPIKSCIRHTLCDDMWVDIDQVNSHPVILNKLMSNYQYSSGLLNNYINNREDILNAIMNDESCSRDDAKNAVISTINGKKYKSNTLLQLHNEIKPGIDKIMKSDEYKDIYDYCKNTFGIKCNMQGKVMSRILQVIENDMLECYIKICHDKGLIPKYKDGHIVSLVFDGFQLIKNDAINDDLLEELRLYAKEETGFDVELKLKPFDKALNIPDDYNVKQEEIEEEDDENDVPDDLKSYEDLKKEFELTHAKILYPPSVYVEKHSLLQNFKNTRDSYMHYKCYVKKTVFKNNKPKIVKEPKQFINIWMLEHDVRYYEQICWKPPPLIHDVSDLNTWKGIKLSSYERNTIGDTNYWNVFLEFCNNLFESKEVCEFILARYAYRLQNPGLRTKVCVIYFGSEGAGKSTFIDTIYNIFDNYAIQIDKAKKLYESHSTFEKEKCFICVNEAGGIDNFENSDVLKTRITEDTLNINPKGIQPYKIDNLCDYDMTTNNYNVVKITDDSIRRWFQTRITNYYIGNDEFFNYYYKNIISNDDALHDIYTGLMNYDWNAIIPSGNFQNKNTKPPTQISKDVKSGNRDKIVWFFKDLTEEKENDDTDNEIKLTNKELFALWNQWCCESRIKYECNNISFGLKVKFLCLEIKSKIKYDFCDKHPHYYIFYKNVFREYIEMID
jgi:hypothetical protein